MHRITTRELGSKNDGGATPKNDVNPGRNNSPLNECEAVEKLLFHVKHHLLTLRRHWIFSGWLLLGACGYSPMYGGSKPTAQLAVTASAHRVPEVDAVEAALEGARSELSRRGVLASGTAYPRLVIEVMRVDESASSIAARRQNPQVPFTPESRGTRVAVTLRGWIEESPGKSHTRDSGDVRRVEFFEYGSDARIDAARYSDAIRIAARAAGRATARRVLGDVEPTDEPF